MANPFEVQTLNPLQALLTGTQAYDGAQKNQQQAVKDAATQQAAQQWQSGNKQGALATLLQGGNFDAASAYGAVDQRDYTRQHDATTDARNVANDARAQSNADRTYGLAVRSANRADDKTPANFIKNADGSYAPIPGSAADPAFIQKQADAWKGSGTAPQTVMPGAAIVRPGTGEVIYKNAPESSLDQSTLETMADQYLAGDNSVFQNLGRGAQGAENVTKLRNIISQRGGEKGMTGPDMAQRSAEYMGEKAAQRTLGTRGVNADLAVTEASNLIPLGRQASANLPRGQFVPVTQAIQAYQRGTSSPELGKFAAANLGIINTYARAISPTGVPTVADKEHAAAVLSTATSPEQYNAVLDQMEAEMKAAQASPGQVKADRRNMFLGKNPHAAQPAAPAPPQVGEFRNGYTYAGGDPSQPTSWTKQ